MASGKSRDVTTRRRSIRRDETMFEAPRRNSGLMIMDLWAESLVRSGVDGRFVPTGVGALDIISLAHMLHDEPVGRGARRDT